jgi:hypothetical protein
MCAENLRWGASSHRHGLDTALIFVLLFAGSFALHIPLLRLPYFWDEAGYYIPAARDLLLTGSVIPHSVHSNAHPPLVMAYLALWWKSVGYTPIVTRTAMLLVAAFSLLGVFRLAQSVLNTEVAIASTFCTALYPVFFTQSSLAMVDLAAAGLVLWGLRAYVENRPAATTAWLSLAVLAKETAVLVPLALFAGECCVYLLPRLASTVPALLRWRSVLLLAPVIPLGLWYSYHRLRTGFLFGNAGFFRYNALETMHLLRIPFAMLMRLWQTFGYMNLYLLTLSALFAMWFPPVRDRDSGKSAERATIPSRARFAFLAIIVGYVFALVVVGGAMLARYMLPLIPLVIIMCISTLWRRVRAWRVVVAIVILGFVLALFVNAPYAWEDNLTYRHYILLHKGADDFLETHFPGATVLTAWPATLELSQPELGYVSRPLRVLQMENFTKELMTGAEQRSNFDVALVFSNQWESHRLLSNWRAVEKIKMRFFGYHSQISADDAAWLLGGHLVYVQAYKGQWVEVVKVNPATSSSLGNDETGSYGYHPVVMSGSGR